MAGASVEFRRLLLRGLHWDAEKAGIFLEEALRSACRARLDETKTGLIVESVGGNGASITFQLPQSASRLTQETISESLSQLYDLYEVAVTELVADETLESADAVTKANNDAIKTRMLALLVARNEAWTDRSCLQV